MARDTVPPIVAWDGEGVAVADGEPQPYVLLMNSAGGVWYARDGLPTAEVFRALIQGARDHRKPTLHFIYGGSYDVNQWLRDLPEPLLRTLWKDGKVRWHGYYIEYRPRKMFRLKHLASNLSITVWDAYPWCQRTFIAALAEYLGRDYIDYDLIAAGKARRSTFADDEREYVQTYTSAELRALVLLVQELIARLYNADIYPNRWDGPGAAAAAMLGAHGMKAHKADTPAGVDYAGAVAYSGGRIELLQYGNYEGTIYHYDIHSAYPAAMVTLPSLANGAWQHYRGAPVLHAHALYHVVWRSPALGVVRPFYPFPFRADDGSIYYPPDGATWVWGPEYIAYCDNAEYWNMDVEVVESYVFNAISDARPFGWVGALYDLRAQWKREGNGAEWALKLGLNSLYGKLAQTIGWTDTRRPPYYQLEWAGLITSFTRAALLRAAMTNPDACVFFATDGLFATERLPLSLGGALGEWGEEIHEGLTCVQSGVYFVKDNGTWRTWSRGYNPDELKRDAILSAWRAHTAKMQIPQTRYLTLGSALASPGKVSAHWRSWRTAPRDLSLRATGKRADATAKSARNPARSLVRSEPAYVTGESLSQHSRPYSRAWKGGTVATEDGVSVLTYDDELAETTI